MEKQQAGERRAVGDLVRHYREVAGLTQEALAERAGISPRGLLYLERGLRRPYPATLRRLADALALGDEQRAALSAALRHGIAEDAAAPPAERRGAAVATAPPAAPPNNLPASLSSFIGREHARARLHDLLATHRLVTLVGPGGVGKTRLALAVAAEMLGTYPDGAWLVDLAPVADPALVADTVAQAMSLREEPGRPVLETLRDHCGGRSMLLLLDNCEHLIAACAMLATALLPVAPGLRILATSRAVLGVAGERRYQLPPLSVPHPDRLPTPELAGSYEAVRLFVARAQERRDTFALTPANGRAVAEICAQLDGLPLAIELAAARVSVMSAEMIAAHLYDRFRLLTTGSGDMPSRQRTLRATLDWSWDLLGAAEQTLLGRLTVFAGGWTLEAAAAICADDDILQGTRHTGAPALTPDHGHRPEPTVVPAPGAVPDLLAGLVAKSLVQADEADGAVRYRLLETVRQYAQERLAARGDDLPADRHLEYFLALAEEAEPRRRGPEQGRWWERLETEHDNQRAALRWATAQTWLGPLGPRVRGLRLAGLLGPFWEWRGYLSEGRRWLDLALAGAGPDVPATARALALNSAASLARQQGDLRQARLWSEEALVLSRSAGDAIGCVAALTTLGISAAIASDFARAQVHFEDALAICRPLGDAALISRLYSYLGNVAASLRDFVQAQHYYEESLALGRAQGDTTGIAAALHNLAWSALQQQAYERSAQLYEEAHALHRSLGNRHHVAHALIGLGNAVRHGRHDLDQAQAHFEESLAIFEELGDRWNGASALSSLGALALERGHLEAAGWWLAESLRLFHDLGERRNIATTLTELAELSAALGRHGRAARLLGAGEALRESIGMSAEAAREGADPRVLALVLAGLSDNAFAAAFAQGRALSMEDAVAMALEGCTAGE